MSSSQLFHAYIVLKVTAILNSADNDIAVPLPIAVEFNIAVSFNTILCHYLHFIDSIVGVFMTIDIYTYYILISGELVRTTL